MGLGLTAIVRKVHAKHSLIARPSSSCRPKRYCLKAALAKSVFEDSDKGVTHVDRLFGEVSLKKQIEQHDEIAAVANHPSILEQMKMIVLERA